MISGDQPIFKEMRLEHAWGVETCRVRVHPPVSVSIRRSEDDALFVCTKPYFSDKIWIRRRVGPRGLYPDTFVAWDEEEGQWALHIAGDDSVTKARTSRTKSIQSLPIRGESEPVVAKGFRPKSSLRSRFAAWWTDKSGANDVPDFIRPKE